MATNLDVWIIFQLSQKRTILALEKDKRPLLGDSRNGIPIRSQGQEGIWRFHFLDIGVYEFYSKLVFRETGLEPGTYRLQVQCPNHQASPFCIKFNSKYYFKAGRIVNFESFLNNLGRMGSIVNFESYSKRNSAIKSTLKQAALFR